MLLILAYSLGKNCCPSHNPNLLSEGLIMTLWYLVTAQLQLSQSFCEQLYLDRLEFFRSRLSFSKLYGTIYCKHANFV